MPLIEYICPSCHLAWNYRVAVLNESHDSQKCKRCQSMVSRQGIPSKLGIQRTGTHSATIDHVVGKDAAVKWDEFHEKKEVRDIVRQESGSMAVTQLPDGSYQSTTAERLSERQKAFEKVKA